MSERICTNFKDDDGLDIGCHLVSKEYLLEAYPELVPWMKAPALWVWGVNSNGQLGNNTNLPRSSPVQTVSTGTNWKSISAGYKHSAGIKTDGTLWLWGRYFVGVLGNQVTGNTSASSPVQTVSNVTTWKQASVSRYNTTAIKTDGTLWNWGDGSAGALGNNSTISVSSPVQTVSNVTTWKQVSTGGASVGGHVAAIKIDGTLWLWGYNGYGQLGTNNNTVNTSSPVQTIATGTNWKQVSAGSRSISAVKNDGSLWSWGSNAEGQLGNNTIAAANSPIQTISNVTTWKQVSMGDRHIAAIKTDGTLWLWGGNLQGAIGDNVGYINRSSPVQTVSNGTNWKEVSTGQSTSAAIKTDGTLWIWGANSGGNLGINGGLPRSSPVQTVSAGTGWKDISLGYSITLAIRDEGEF